MSGGAGGRKFIGEIWQRGDPDLRPDSGRVLISRTPGMAALEAKLCGRTLLCTVTGDRRIVSPDTVIATIEACCSVQKREVKIKVICPPHDFILNFQSAAACTRMLDASHRFRHAAAALKFSCWHRGVGAVTGKLEYWTRLCFEGVPQMAWDLEAVKQVVAQLRGELIKMIPSSDRWILEVHAWLYDPSAVPEQIVVVVISEPDTVYNLEFSDENTDSVAAPSSPTMKYTQDFPVTVHVCEVIDRGPLLSDLPSNYVPGNTEDLTQHHTFPCWRGRVDGTGQGDAAEGGGNMFGSSGSNNGRF